MSAIAKAGTVAAGPTLEAPKSTPFTTEELKTYDGSVEGRPIYVAIKGQIFDGKFLCLEWITGERKLIVWFRLVSAKKEMYGPGAGYHVSLSPQLLVIQQFKLTLFSF